MHMVLSQDLWSMHAEAGECSGQGFDEPGSAAGERQEEKSGLLSMKVLKCSEWKVWERE